MSNSQLEQVLDITNELGEGPIWSIDRQTLYWVDLTAGVAHWYVPASGQVGNLRIGMSLGAVALWGTDGLLMATKKGLARWTPALTEPDFFANPFAADARMRFNDGAVDPAGRFWVGSTADSKKPDGLLYQLSQPETIKVMETGVTMSNGIGWSPDHKTMYYTDSEVHTIYAYDFDLATGQLENRRIFVHDPHEAGVPDGLTVDEEGGVWSARWNGWKLTRYTPKGEVDRIIEVPVQFPTSCAFGGANLDELYITSALKPVKEADRAAQPLAGRLMCIRSQVRGLPEPIFGSYSGSV